MGETEGGSSNEVPLSLSHYLHLQLIGYLGLLLPFILFGLAAVRPIPGLPRWDTLNSVSAYYYSGAVAVFTGVLVAMSLFLFTYRGYSESRADRVLGKVGGAAAACVAVFPTSAPRNLTEPVWWSELVRTVHYVGAFTLFGVFIVFAIWLFRRSDVPRSERSGAKRRKNNLFLGCGLVMIGAVAWAASSVITHKPIFWPEVIALWAFALSWLVKGEGYNPILHRLQSARDFMRQGEPPSD
jgi:hypothetical protein